MHLLSFCLLYSIKLSISNNVGIDFELICEFIENLYENNISSIFNE